MGDKQNVQVKAKEEEATKDQPAGEANKPQQQEKKNNNNNHNKKKNHHNHHRGGHNHRSKQQQQNNSRSKSPKAPTTASPHQPITKEDLWKGAEVKTLVDNEGWIVEMTGLDSKSHTVYARAVSTADYKPSLHPNPTVKTVVDSVVDVAWKHVAKHILESKKEKKVQEENKKKQQQEGDDSDLAQKETLMVDLDHWNQGAFPPADQLLELGAVWLVNETFFLKQEAEHCNSKKNNHGGHHHHHHHTKKKRLTTQQHGQQQPDWKDYVLRVHYAPNRFHAMDEVDWNKYCRGLLMGDGSVQVFVGNKLLKPHDHILPSGYPNQKDGVIVYEDSDHGFAVLNKPGTVPDHATVNNHAEDVLTVFSHVLQDREKEVQKIPKEQRKKDKQNKDDPLRMHHHSRAAHLSLPLPLDTETQGLVIIATKRAFGSYLTNLVEHPPPEVKNGNGNHHHMHMGVTKKYKCLVCVKKPEDMMLLNNLQESGAVAKHYYHHNPNHKDHTNFVDAIPERQHPHEYGVSQIRILKIGTNHGLYAANVTSDKTVGDVQLAQRLWGLGVQNRSKTPAEDLGVAYVAQVEVEQVVDAEQLHTHLNRPSRLTPQQMICGQLAAMGFPLVGDSVHGGGTSEVWGHRHGWNRLALQCCEWSFPQPQWKIPLDRTTSSGDSAGTLSRASSSVSSDEGTPEAAEEKKEDTPGAEEKKEDTTQSPGEDTDGWKTISSKKTNGHKEPDKEEKEEKSQPQPQQKAAPTSRPKKSHLISSHEERCVFRLNEAWWNPLLDQYHVDGF